MDNFQKPSDLRHLHLLDVYFTFVEGIGDDSLNLYLPIYFLANNSVSLNKFLIHGFVINAI
jgi:hypothetical protein